MEKVEALSKSSRTALRRTKFEDLRWWALTRWDRIDDRIKEAEAEAALTQAWTKGEEGSSSGELKRYRKPQHAMEELAGIMKEGSGKGNNKKAVSRELTEGR